MSEQPVPDRYPERVADFGVARMLAALAALHLAAGGVVAAVLERRTGLLVVGADVLAAAVLAGSAAVAVRLGPHARGRVPGSGRGLDLSLLIAALGVAGVATALRIVATGATWVALELPLVVVVAAALPRRQALTATVAAIAPAAGAIAAVVGRPRARVRPPGGPAAGDRVPAAAVVALAWRRRVHVLTQRLGHAELAAREVAVRDAMTGAVNRSGLELVAVPLIHHARRQGEAAHCLFVDVDGFRAINDTAGPHVGDDLLRAVAAAVMAAVRSTDVVARWSGDEFVVVGPGTGTSPLELERRVHAHLAQVTPVPAEVWTPRVSIGSPRSSPGTRATSPRCCAAPSRTCGCAARSAASAPTATAAPSRRRRRLPARGTDRTNGACMPPLR